ncbi:hypothetical protein [Burkholderia gladioli]|uniref:hypothetical protein n=1 Tax=Burkholderia gladioli TaxID=28095 RepID=UPI001641D0DB|nr:hypothetical protein [Burkholderia gladioli]
MDELQRTEIFEAQTQNVRGLERAWHQINRQINSSIIQNNNGATEALTKVLTVVYCALAEALFSKLIHTPKCLSLAYVDQIKNTTTAKGVKAGWIKCAELAIQNVEGAKTNHEHNTLKKLHELIEKFIHDPSLIRNKLAHGQWQIALNRDNTAINISITQEIKDHTVVELYRRKHALEKLSAIIEDIIESPNKAHRRDYWIHLIELETTQQEMSLWTFEGKVAQLRKKKSLAP